MAETEHSQNNLAALRTDVEQLRTMQRFAIASNPTCKSFVEQHLEDTAGAAQAYLAIAAGPKTLDDIMSELKKVSREPQRFASIFMSRGGSKSSEPR